MKKNILKKASIGIAFGLTLLPFLVLAQINQPTPIISKPGDITVLIQNIMNWVAGIVMVIAMIMLLWSAILYMTAGGAEDKVTRAKNYLIYAIVGIVVALLVFSVVPFIANVLLGRFY